MPSHGKRLVSFQLLFTNYKAPTIFFFFPPSRLLIQCNRDLPSHPTNPHLLINKWKASCLLDKSIFMFSAFQMACIGSHCADFGELESLEVLRWSFPWYYNKCFNKMLDFEFMDFSWISYVVKSFHLKCIQPLFRDTNEKAAVPFKELK